jgi:hypothetical protein
MNELLAKIEMLDEIKNNPNLTSQEKIKYIKDLSESWKKKF